jgi:hypothetical protein
MTLFPDPSRQEQNDFLVRLYFGPGNDLLGLCLKRAYLDLCRTVHGIAKSPAIYPAAKRFLREVLSQLSLRQEHFTQEQFDTWHEAVCRGLVSIYKEHGYATFSIGQAQKWINMAFKYVYLIGEEKLSGFSSFYELCHVPIDNIITKNLAFANPPAFTRPWSRIERYEEYMLFQHWVRSTFEGSSPLAVEFRFWREAPVAD